MSLAAGKKALFTLAYNSENSVDFIKMISITFKGFPGGSRGKEPSCQYRRHKRLGFDSWVKIGKEKAFFPTINNKIRKQPLGNHYGNK